MIYKILRKLKLNRIALSMASPFLRTVITMSSPEKARALLTAHSPDPGNSCITERPSAGKGDFELDIIVPAYNVEKYIARCIDSVLSQDTDCKWRLIVIDDGSVDSTGKIIDSYAEDPRLLIIHQENRGFSGARNRGLSHSDAEHIMFLDSDDSLCPGAIEALIQGIHEDAAITEGGFNIVDPEGKIMGSRLHKEGPLDLLSDLEGFPWAKVFRRSLFEGICLPEGYWYEDSLMIQVIYPLSQSRGYKALGVRQAVYNYTMNPAGITANSRKRPKAIDSLWITLQLHKDRQKLGLENDQSYYEYILNMISISYRRAENQGEDVKKAMFVVWKDFLEKEFSGFDTVNKNKKILQQAVLEGNFKLYSLACKLI